MKRIFTALFALLAAIPANAQKFESYAATSTPATSDLLLMAVDVSGTFRTRKITLQNFATRIGVLGIVQPYDAELAQIAALADPGADRIAFWDDSAGSGGSWAWLTLGTNLSITGTTLNATGGGGGSFTDSAGLASTLTDETGTGFAVFSISPTLTTPILGTPTSATLTNATGLPIATGVSGLGAGIPAALAINTGSAGAPALINGVLGTPQTATLTNATGLPISTGVSGLGSGVATFLGTPSSANLATAVTGETGTGALVFGTAPTIDGPTITSALTLSNALLYTDAAMGALAVDVAELSNTKSISVDSTLTFSATPAAGTQFGLVITNSDTASHVITIPSSVSDSLGAARTTFTLAASSTASLRWRYNGSTYRLWGDPVTVNDLTAATPAIGDQSEFYDATDGLSKKAQTGRLPSAAGSSTLSNAGETAYNTTNKVLGIHNGTKEVGVSTIYHQAWSFDPKAVCDGAVDRLFLMSTDISEPFGIHVIKWKVSFEADPTTEVDLDLKRADAFIGVANSAVMDVLDTTTGASSEATSSNINGDAVVATGKVLYLEFGTAYTEANHQIVFEMFWELEED